MTPQADFLMNRALRLGASLTFPDGMPATVGEGLARLAAGGPVRLLGTEAQVQAFTAELQTACDALRARFAAGEVATVPRLERTDRIKPGDRFTNTRAETDSDDGETELVTPAGSVWAVTEVQHSYISIVCEATGGWINPTPAELRNPAMFNRITD